MLRFLGRYARRYLGSMALLFAVTIPLFGASSTVMVALVEPIFSEVLQADPASIAPGLVPAPAEEPSSALDFKNLTRAAYDRLRDALSINDQNAYWFLPALFLGVFLVRAISSFFNTYTFQRIGLGITNDIRNDLYRRMLEQSSAFHATHPSGEIISRAVSDVALMQLTVTSRLVDLFQQSLALVLLTILLLSTHLQLALLCLVGLPLFVLAIARFGDKIRRHSIRGQERMADVTALLSEGVRGHRVVKAFGMEEFESKRFGEATARHLRVSLRAQFYNSLSSPVIESLAAVGAAMLLVYAASRIRAGELTAPMLVQFLANLLLMYDPIRRLNKVNLVLQQALAGAKRVREIMEAPNEVVEAPNARTIDGVRNEIRFEGVRFAYGKEAVLRGIDLTIRTGEIVALVGPSGAGKTTLVNLLPRFFDPTKGRILIDGTDIREATLRSLRDQIGIVSQETVLFNDTIRNNIAYGRSDLPREEIEAAARAAFADAFIRAQPDGYDTVVGESGGQLSGGQRQRLTIARAILKDPPILVLDEATSHLDSESEALVQKALYNLMRDRTTLVVAHRLATVMRATRIVVMEAGTIVETGTHAELLERDGLYRKLYDLQFQGT